MANGRRRNDIGNYWVFRSVHSLKNCSNLFVHPICDLSNRCRNINIHLAILQLNLFEALSIRFASLTHFIRSVQMSLHGWAFKKFLFSIWEMVNAESIITLKWHLDWVSLRTREAEWKVDNWYAGNYFPVIIILSMRIVFPTPEPGNHQVSSATALVFESIVNRSEAMVAS